MVDIPSNLLFGTASIDMAPEVRHCTINLLTKPFIPAV